MPRRASDSSKVCLLSQHPLVLGDFDKALRAARVPVRAHRLESTLASELRQPAVPAASVYVIDALGQPGATQALVAGLLEQNPGARLLVVTEKFDAESTFPLLRLGVKGLLKYAEVHDHLPRAVKTVTGGGFWVPRSLLAEFVDSVLGELRGRRLVDVPPGLSQREREVLSALLENLSNKEIANKLHISERTVKFHVSNLLGKFGVQRRADLILLHFQKRPPA